MPTLASSPRWHGAGVPFAVIIVKSTYLYMALFKIRQRSHPPSCPTYRSLLGNFWLLKCGIESGSQYKPEGSGVSKETLELYLRWYSMVHALYLPCLRRCAHVHAYPRGRELQTGGQGSTLALEPTYLPAFGFWDRNHRLQSETPSGLCGTEYASCLSRSRRGSCSCTPNINMLLSPEISPRCAIFHFQAFKTYGKFKCTV